MPVFPCLACIPIKGWLTATQGNVFRKEGRVEGWGVGVCVGVVLFCFFSGAEGDLTERWPITYTHVLILVYKYTRPQVRAIYCSYASAISWWHVSTSRGTIGGLAAQCTLVQCSVWSWWGPLCSRPALRPQLIWKHLKCAALLVLGECVINDSHECGCAARVYNPLPLFTLVASKKKKKKEEWQ